MANKKMTQKEFFEILDKAYMRGETFETLLNYISLLMRFDGDREHLLYEKDALDDRLKWAEGSYKQAHIIYEELDKRGFYDKVKDKR